MTTTSNQTGADASAEESVFVPTPEPPRYAPPKATVDPRPELGWFQRVRPLAMAHKWLLLTSVAATFAGLVIQVQIPDVMRRAIDDALVAGSSPLIWYVGAILGLGVLRFVTGCVSRTLLLRTGYRVEFDLRNIVYAHLTQLSFSFYDRTQSGYIISRANSDIRSVQMYLAFAPNIITQCAVAVVAFFYMASIHLGLALVVMSTMPFVFLVGMRMRERIFPVSWLTQQRLAEVANVVNENVNGVRVVKSFAAEERELSTLDLAARRARWATVTDASIRARWAPLMENLSRVGTAVVLVYGGWLVLDDQTTIGALVAFNAYVLMIQPPFRMLGMLMMMSRRAAASAKRIYEILDERPAIVDRPGAVDLRNCEGEVVFDDVTFSYGEDVPVLRGVDLRLRPGDTVALVGRTAAGKSTLARLLCRFYDVGGGAVRVDGHDVRELTLRSLRHHVGMVFDEPFLFSASVRDNIAYGRPDAKLEDVVRAARAAGAEEFIEQLDDGYDTVVGERGYTLSGGQRQRLSIARTLLLNPKVLVLDDATSAIDVQVEQRIHAALSELMRDRTTLIIAHRLSTISLADRVAVLDEGRIVAEGTHAELLANEPRYTAILAQEIEDDLEELQEWEPRR